MTTPKTFSSPLTTTAPVIADRLRDGVYLMLMADDENRRYYSYDEDAPELGVRIAAGFAFARNGSFDVPQQLIQNVTANERTEYNATHDAVERVTIAVVHFEKPTSAKIEVDVAAPPLTPETICGRTVEILRRGTIWQDGQNTNSGRVIDPYSPLLIDGTYDPELLRYINELVPVITYGQPQAIARGQLPADLRDYAELDPATQIAVLYTVLATYEIDLADRENLRLGGYANG